MSIAAESSDGAPGGPWSDDHALIAALHLEFYDRLVRVCSRHLRDRGLAEDLAQETILRALRFWDSYDAERPTWPWLKAIAQRLCADAHRERSREVCLDAVPEKLETSDLTDALLDEITVRRAMARLPERQRLALRLRYLDDRDRDDSAQVLGVNVNAFDQLLSRARVGLASVMGPVRAGASLGVLWIPLRWMRRRLPRRAAGGIAGTSVTTLAALPFAVAPLLAVVVGIVAVAYGQAPTTQPRLVASQSLARPALHHASAVAPHVTRTPAQPVRRRTSTDVLVAAGPARAEASVAKNPLGRGTVESHQLRIVTPLTTVNVGGSSDRDPGGGALCGLPVVDCGS